MVARVGQDGALRRKAVRGIMQWHPHEDAVQNPVLRALEARHRRRDQSLATTLLGREALIVIDRRHLSVEREEAQLAQRYARRVSQRLGIGERQQAAENGPKPHSL
jgi:hypothetical protein